MSKYRPDNGNSSNFLGTAATAIDDMVATRRVNVGANSASASWLVPLAMLQKERKEASFTFIHLISPDITIVFH